MAALEEELSGRNEPYFIICLSHSGTDGRGKGEDYQLARKVDGIDLIISGHTHTTLTEPIQVGGHPDRLRRGLHRQPGLHHHLLEPQRDKEILDYRLIPVDETVAEDPAMVRMVNTFQPLVEEQYLDDYGVGFDEVLAVSDFSFTPIEQLGEEQREDTLGNLIADSYVYAVQQAEGADYVPVDFAVVAAG